ncbi:MAG TPA: ABC transporter ATP-binding protein [Nocardioidaceae bacterium]|nr:ABC transporter ATP-binding protein [Nocardioidaceae bacterium]
MTRPTERVERPGHAESRRQPERGGQPERPAHAEPAGPGGGGVLDLVGLTKRFGAFTAVDGIDLTVPAGSFFALLGPSGCGKTTTLRMIAGLENPTSGQILLDGADVSSRKAHKRPVNTVFQNYALFPHLSIFENVAFGLRRRGIKKVDTQVEEMLELVELGGYGRRRPGQLSGGQQQRVALARALINRPQVLLLDEPLGALDLKLRRQMQIELKRIQTEVGITFVHVTHDQEEAMTMADTVAVMNQGRVDQLGEPEELYDNPASTYVANFLGQSNLLRVRVRERSGGDVVVDAGGPRLLRLPAARCVSGSDEIFVGIRPEKVHIGTRSAVASEVSGEVAGEVADGMNQLDGVVTDASFTGMSTQYLVRLAWGQEITVFVQNLSGARIRPGTEVTVSWEAGHSFGLDAAQDAHAGERDQQAGSAPAGSEAVETST